MRTCLCLCVLVITPLGLAGRSVAQEPFGKDWIVEHFDKREVLVPMRDGVKLFTSIYTPKKSSEQFPILLKRTPYSCAPYGEKVLAENLGPSKLFLDKGYAFVSQDVRGAYMSEGSFVDMRPHIEGKSKPSQIDEASDAFDTVDWLVKNLPGNNGNVGMWGISYPGFYASAGMIDAHPALKAVSPQAPIADWWYDDFHHNGALFLPHAFNFLAGFGRPRPEPTQQRSFKLEHGTPDGYRFFLELGSLANVNEKWFHNEVAMWNDMVAHPNYDEYWSARNLLPHLKHVAPAVMTVGGWFDAEDLYGALNTYRAIEEQNPGIYNVLVMGPWAHGGWSRGDGDRLGNARFGEKTGVRYRQDMELAFFEHYLHAAKVAAPAEANVFDSGANVWRSFDAWPPKEAKVEQFVLSSGFEVFRGYDDGHSGDSPVWKYDEFISDPAHPVPFTDSVATGMTREYMTDDQRFVATRPDVLCYRSEALAADLTLAGPLDTVLKVSTSGTDSDWIVKLIDEFPPDAQDPKDADALSVGEHLGGFQMLVRSEVMRGRFRNDPSKPEPFVSNHETECKLRLQDVLHTFKKGHRLMIQIHCTWFPLVDRNPQKFVSSIYAAKETDFVVAQQRVWDGTGFTVPVLANK